MKKIHKGRPPVKLTEWIASNPRGVYKKLETSTQGHEVRQAIRAAAISEQHCLCAYCCARIDVDNSHNEHVVPQSTALDRTVDFSNIVASCNTPKQCGAARGNQFLPLTPLDDACEVDLKFYLNGEVRGQTPEADQTIKAINLNRRRLRDIRKTMVDTLLFEFGTTTTGISLLDDDFLSLIIEDIQQYNEHGCSSPYGPVAINIIKSFLSC